MPMLVLRLLTVNFGFSFLVLGQIEFSNGFISRIFKPNKWQSFNLAWNFELEQN